MIHTRRRERRGDLDGVGPGAAGSAVEADETAAEAFVPTEAAVAEAQSVYGNGIVGAALSGAPLGGLG